jgi:negative regulator of flagellin synthesis FlgM
MSRIDGGIGTGIQNAVDRGGVGTPLTGGTGQTLATGTASTPAEAVSPQASTDSVSITDSARLLADLSTAVAATPDVDQARVATLRHAIESGTYIVNAQRIADNLLGMERQLGGRT